MDADLKLSIEALGHAFEEFKVDNDARLKLVEDNKHVDPVLLEKIDRINTDMTAIMQMKTQLEDLENAMGRMELPGHEGQSAEQTNALKEHAAAFSKWFRKGGDANFEAMKELEIKASLSTLDDPNGGFLIAPPEFDQAIDRVAGTLSAMRRLATVRTIGVDTFKKLVNQGGTTSGWVAEKESRTETDTPTIREIEINMKEIYAEPGATQISLDDSFMDLANWLADEVSIEFDEEEGTAFITGDGVKRPHGIAAYSKVANASYAWGKTGFITSGSASNLTDLDALIALQHALKPRYRGGATFLMNDSTSEVIRKLKDGDGNYIWRPGLMLGQPDVLLGKPIDYDDNVASISAGTFPIIYANFKRAYLVLDRMGIRILRDPYTSKGNVLFYTTKRVSGGIVMYEAVKLLKISA